LGKDEEKGKAEKVAEKSGEVVGKSLKKGFGVAKGIGSGIKKELRAKTKKRERNRRFEHLPYISIFSHLLQKFFIRTKKIMFRNKIAKGDGFIY
jgi:hypothetical protein